MRFYEVGGGGEVVSGPLHLDPQLHHRPRDLLDLGDQQ